jgi:hypothetical protein
MFCRHACIVMAVLIAVFTWVIARAESTASSSGSSVAEAEPLKQDNGKAQVRKCPRCGEPATRGKACKNCGYIFRGSTGGADAKMGVQNRLKSDVSNINRTNSSINQSMRSLNNSLRDMRQNIFQLRDIHRRF